MTTLRTAAQQALEAMLNFPDDISDEMFESITALKAALVEDALQKFSDVNQELEAALAEHDKNLAGFKERKANWDIRAPRSPRDLQCKLAEETQERDRQRREYEEQRLAALAEPVQDVKGCDVCEHPLYAGIKCRVCGRVTQAEPVQEPVADRAFLERILAAMEGVIDVADRKTDEFDALRSCVIDLTLMLHTAPPQRPAEPVQDPVAWIHTDPNMPRVKFLEWRENEPGYRGDWIKTPLYTTPQRKPLTKVDLRALYDQHAAYQEEGPEASGWWEFARAIEAKHGITS